MDFRIRYKKNARIPKKNYKITKLHTDGWISYIFFNLFLHSFFYYFFLRFFLL